MNSTAIEPRDDTARPILFVIDVEPDDRHTTPNRSGWESSEAALDKLEVLRGELQTATGRPVKFNWFFRCDTQIEQTFGRADYVAEACPRVLRSVIAHGDAAGIHIHLWRWNEKDSRWFNDFADRQWIADSLDVSLKAFESIFGHPPEMARFGDRWLSQQAVDLMIAAGIRYDLTVEPGLPGGGIHDDSHASGTLPDYRCAPRFPYHPRAGSYLEPSSQPTQGRLWMIPVSTTPPGWRLVRRSPYILRASRSPNLALSASYVWPHLENELAKPGRAPLVTVFRSGDLSVAKFRRNFDLTTSRLARHPGLKYCEFTDPAGAIAHWLSVIDA